MPWTELGVIRGPQGPAGPQGIPGPQGEQGPPGASVHLPPGTIAMFAGVHAPDGWLLCNGADYAASEYPELFAVIGATYGGTGGTFRVPDLMDRFPRGASTPGPSGGALSHNHTMDPHTHNLNGHTHTSAAHSHSHTHGGHSHSHTHGSHSHNHSHNLNTGSPQGHARIRIATGDVLVGMQANTTVASWNQTITAHGAQVSSASTLARTVGAVLAGNTGTDAAATTPTADATITTPTADATSTTPAATGGSSALTSSTAQASNAVDLLPPWLGVNFIIKT